MNCSKCGSSVPPNVVFCPICNEPTGIRLDEMVQDAQINPVQESEPVIYAPQSYAPQQGYAAQPGYPPQNYAPQGYAPQGYTPQDFNAQSYAPQNGAYQPQQNMQQNAAFQPGYPQYNASSSMPGYQPPYKYGQPNGNLKPADKIVSVLKELPKNLIDSILRPADLLRRNTESHDTIFAPTAAGIALLLSFLFGMALTRSVVWSLISGLSSTVGSYVGTASFKSEIGEIIGYLSPSIGGIYVLCQLLVLAVPIAISMAYLCVVRKARFSTDLLFGYLSVTALPVSAFLILMILLSFISPLLALLPLVCSAVVTCVQMSSLTAFVTSSTETELHKERIICCSLSVFICIILVALIGGGLLKGAIENLAAVIGNGSLGMFL